MLAYTVDDPIDVRHSLGATWADTLYLFDDPDALVLGGSLLLLVAGLLLLDGVDPGAVATWRDVWRWHEACEGILQARLG